MMTIPPGAIHTFKNASQKEDAECYMTATPGQYVDCECWTPLCLYKVCVDQSLDFRMLAKVTEAGKPLTMDDVRHMMALFGTFPPEVDSEP